MPTPTLKFETEEDIYLKFFVGGMIDIHPEMATSRKSAPDWIFRVTNTRTSESIDGKAPTHERAKEAATVALWRMIEREMRDFLQTGELLYNRSIGQIPVDVHLNPLD